MSDIGIPDETILSYKGEPCKVIELHEPCHEKTCYGVSVQVQQKLGCTVLEHC